MRRAFDIVPATARLRRVTHVIVIAGVVFGAVLCLGLVDPSDRGMGLDDGNSTEHGSRVPLPVAAIIAAAMTGVMGGALMMLTTGNSQAGYKAGEAMPIQALADIANVDRLISSLSHELKTPLTIILGNAALIERDATDETRELASAIRHGGCELLNRLDLLMTFAHLQAGTYASICSVTDLASDVAQLVEKYERRADARTVGFQADIDEKIGSVDIDGRAVQQIAEILLDNAIRLTDAGTILFRLSSTKDGIRITVSDTGTGVQTGPTPDGVSGRLAGSHEVEGARLGLIVADGLAQRIDGSLEIRSRAGAGTIADFHLQVERRPGTLQAVA